MCSPRVRGNHPSIWASVGHRFVWFFGGANASVGFVPPSRSRSYDVGIAGSWEIDVFGRIRRSVEASTADLQQSIEDHRDTLVVPYAQVGVTYVDVRTFQERIDGGRIRSNIRVQEALTQQTLASYEQTVLEAVEDAESSMIALIEEQNRRDALQRSATAAAVELVQTLCRTGLTDFQNVLDTERSLFTIQDDLAQSQGLVTQNLIAVYQALGGGWTP